MYARAVESGVVARSGAKEPHSTRHDRSYLQPLLRALAAPSTHWLDLHEGTSSEQSVAGLVVDEGALLGRWEVAIEQRDTG